MFVFGFTCVHPDTKSHSLPPVLKNLLRTITTYTPVVYPKPLLRLTIKTDISCPDQRRTRSKSYLKSVFSLFSLLLVNPILTTQRFLRRI